MPSRLKKLYKLGNNVSFLIRKNNLIFRSHSTLATDRILCNYANNILFNNKCCCFSTTKSPRQQNENDLIRSAKLELSNGSLKITLYLPGRREDCVFSLKPLNDTVGDLVEYLKKEDKSIEKALVYSSDGVRVAQNTSIGQLVTNPFSIKINDFSYNIEPPEYLLKQASSSDSELVKAQSDIEEVRKLVSKLYLHLNVEQFESEREEKIAKELEILKNELLPMERTREQLALKAKKHTNRMVWLGLGLMSVQMGVMARLTWFDYSWDIVEPISYFVSYTAVVGVYAYFVLTRKEYDYESASDRIFLRHLHKNAIKQNLNLNRYNELKNSVFMLENDLKKIQESQLKSKLESKT